MTSEDELHVRHLRRPELFHAETHDETPQDIPGGPFGLIFNLAGSRNWCSAARPGSAAGFAVGRTGHFAMLNDLENGGGHVSTKTPDPGLLSARDDILAVDWLNQNILVGGARSGKVLLGDIRTSGGEFGLRFQFHRGIQHVKTLDSNRIAVAALNSKVRTVSSSSVLCISPPHYEGSTPASPSSIMLRMLHFALTSEYR